MTGAACNRSTTGNTARGNTGKAHLFGPHGRAGACWSYGMHSMCDVASIVLCRQEA